MSPEKRALDCVGLAGKAGGLRTAAEALRTWVAEHGDLPAAAALRLAAEIDKAADKTERQSFALLPVHDLKPV